MVAVLTQLLTVSAGSFYAIKYSIWSQWMETETNKPAITGDYHGAGMDVKAGPHWMTGMRKLMEWPQEPSTQYSRPKQIHTGQSLLAPHQDKSTNANSLTFAQGALCIYSPFLPPRCEVGVLMNPFPGEEVEREATRNRTWGGVCLIAAPRDTCYFSEPSRLNHPTLLQPLVIPTTHCWEP